MRINVDLANMANLYRMRIKAALQFFETPLIIPLVSRVIVDQNRRHFSLFAWIINLFFLKFLNSVAQVQTI